MISGEDVCCSVVFGTLVGVFVFSVMWSELLMTSVIYCPLWPSVYECQIVACAFTSPVRTVCVMRQISQIQTCVCVVVGPFICLPISHDTTQTNCMRKIINEIV